MWHAWDRRGKCIQDFRGKTRRKETTWKNRGWEDGIKMYLRETGVAGSCEHNDELVGSGNTELVS
jgi:hypothetical protein